MTNAETQLFFDRARRLDEPFANLSAGQSRLYAVVGGPSAGKSALLRQLEARLLAQAGPPRMVPVSLDLKQVSLGSLESAHDALALLLEQVRDCLKREPYNLCALLDSVMKLFDRGTHKPVDSFSEAFGYMRSTAVSHLGEVRIVLLLDNADELAGLDIARDLFNSFHALFQDTRLNGFLDFVLAGGDGLYDRLTEPNTIWLNDANLILLAPFEPSEAAAFLQAQTGNGLPAHVGLLIYAFSGGHPFLLRHFLAELESMNGDDWAAVTADMVADIAEDFADADAQRQIDIWRVPDTDAAQMTHAAYRLLIQNRPSPANLTPRLEEAASRQLPESLSALATAFAAGSDAPAALAAQAAQIAADLGAPLPGDWSGRLAALRDEIPALYHTLVYPFGELRRADFRRALGQTGEQGYSYKRALDRLLYLGAAQLSRRKGYFIQGQLALEQFQEFSPQGKFSLIAGLQNRLSKLVQNLNTLQEQKANFGDLDVPLNLVNNIRLTQEEIEEARAQLEALKAE